MRFLVFSFSLFLCGSAFAQTAKDVALDMKVEGIEFVHAFTEEDDLNNQLGRPNQYVEKVSWPDKRIDPKFESDGFYDDEIDPSEFKGGTIEKFRNSTDLNRRYEYIKNIYLSSPFLNQYMYKKGLFLMRLDKDFTPTQAKKYELEFYKVLK
ncbi:hypothetical protein [Acinetobacter nosocomialis]|uniref:hypothetical protein n=1 Tax=Acinetobacter nosocomialis TaxID=106654 RepID=UPI00054BE2F4|nr:hypothetical protein [Acinetobacter nosocomialis]PSD71864.1 hypothetical protein C7G80_07180 [Acinetobacter nosocomialis]